MAMAPDMVTEFGLLPMPTSKVRCHSSGSQTARERQRMHISCGYNYLTERKDELAQVRTLPSPSALARELSLTPRFDINARLPPKKTPPVLASSIHRGAFWKAPSPMEKASHAYQWVPVHVRQLDPACGGRQSIRALEEHAVGTYVTTLTLNIRKETFEKATAHFLRLDPTHFMPNSGKPWCYLLNGNSPFVVLRGVVTRVGRPRERGELAQPLMVGRLPEGYRPLQPLRFAALARQAEDTGGHSSRLVTLTALPSGEIVTEVGPGGRDEVTVGSSIDLSAIRFSTGRGISLIDDVCLHICDVGGTRIAGLQGELSERCFELHGRKLVALLPESCRPPQKTHFVVSGTCGGFHLMAVRPTTTYTAGGNGDLVWQDGKWNRDIISMNGIMFEVAAASLQFPNPLEERSITEGQAIAIMDFQKYLIRRFGTIESAWNQAFDTDGSGSVNFTEFGLGCKAAGYVGNASRLWAALDEDLSGSISVEELGLDADELLATVRAKAEGRESPAEAKTLLPRGSLRKSLMRPSILSIHM